MKGRWPILGRSAELKDAHQLTAKQLTLEVEGSIIHAAAEIRRPDNKVVNDRMGLTRGTPQKSASPLDELPRIGGTGEQEAQAHIGQVNSLVQAANCDDSI